MAAMQKEKHHHSLSSAVSSLKGLFHIGAVQKFFEKLQSPDISVQSLGPDGDSILHAIIRRQFKSRRQKEQKRECLMVLLLHSDIDVNQLNARKTTALHIAVEAGDTQSVKTLLVFGANINALDGNNKTPLDLVEGPYRFLTRQESGFTVVDVDAEAISPVVGKRKPLLKQQPSFTDDELDGVKSDFEMPRMHAATTAFTTTFSKSGDVSGMAKLLSDHGGERGRKMRPKDVQLNVQQFEDMVVPELKERVCTLSKVHRQSHGHQDDWTTKIAKLHFEILNNIQRKLLCVDYPLSRHPDEAMAVGIQMKELKMLQDAGSRILFLDGGGMKGLIQIELLSQLEEHTGRKVTELFDWIVGTSTGGIVALALVYGKKTLKEIRQLYFRLREDVFGSGRLGMGYDTPKLEEILQHEFGTKMTMDDISYPRVIVSAVDKSTINLKLTYFNNCFEDEFSKIPVWKVARYTSGGPIYFTPLDDYVDGGVLANNPSAGGLTRIQEYYFSKKQKLPISLVVSIGSGKLPENELGNVDAHEFLYLGKHWFDFKAHLSGRTKNLTMLLGNAIGESENIAENVESRCKEQGVDYYRFSPQLTKVISSGETDLDTLHEMVLMAKKSISLNQSTKDSAAFRRLIWRFHDCSLANKKMRHRLLLKTSSQPF